jgi:hypothetical protein
MSDNRIKSGIKMSLFGLHMIAKLAVLTLLVNQSLLLLLASKAAGLNYFLCI